jgi:hypothetical protein
LLESKAMAAVNIKLARRGFMRRSSGLLGLRPQGVRNS